jgi:uncharacterized protein YndB with AHSA1/START domain
MINRSATRRLTQSISINATPERLWDLITRINAIADWYDTWDRVEAGTTERHLREGTSFRLIRCQTGHNDEVAHCQVTEFLEVARLQWRQSTPHQPTTSVSFDLVPHATDGTTELHQTRTWTIGYRSPQYRERQQ